MKNKKIKSIAMVVVFAALTFSGCNVSPTGTHCDPTQGSCSYLMSETRCLMGEVCYVIHPEGTRISTNVELDVPNGVVLFFAGETTPTQIKNLEKNQLALRLIMDSINRDYAGQGSAIPSCIVDIDSATYDGVVTVKHKKIVNKDVSGCLSINQLEAKVSQFENMECAARTRETQAVPYQGYYFTTYNCSEVVNESTASQAPQSGSPAQDHKTSLVSSDGVITLNQECKSLINQGCGHGTTNPEFKNLQECLIEAVASPDNPFNPEHGGQTTIYCGDETLRFLGIVKQKIEAGKVKFQ